MKKKLAAVLSIAAVAAVGIYATLASASAINVSYDFENGQTPSWSALYGNADMSIETEDSGNKYLRLSYNGEENRGRDYYDVVAASISILDHSIIQADYDVMYSNIDTEKDGEIQFKQRVGPGSSETTMVTRVGKNMNYFRTQSESNNLTAIKNLSDKALEIEVGHWYSVKVVVDLDEGMQSILIFDRDSEELLAYSEYANTIGSNKDINMITFSSGTDMCVDNVHIYSPSCESGYIYGSPYISSATKNKYYFLGRNSDGSFTAMPQGTMTWSLETELTGVSIDSSTARIIVGSKPEPGMVVLKAENAASSGTFTEKYIVNVSQ